MNINFENTLEFGSEETLDAILLLREVIDLQGYNNCSSQIPNSDKF